MENNFFKNANLVSNPLGSWSDLNPTFSRQFKALLKKNFLIRIRNISFIIEIFVAFLIPLILILVYFPPKVEFPNTISPLINKTELNTLIEWFLVFGKQTKVSIYPDNEKMRFLIGNATLLNILIHGGKIPLNGTLLDLPGTTYNYTNDVEQLKEVIILPNSTTLALSGQIGIMKTH